MDVAADISCSKRLRADPQLVFQPPSHGPKLPCDTSSQCREYHCRVQRSAEWDLMPQIETTIDSPRRRPVVRRLTACSATWLIVVGITISLSGCRDDGTIIWSKEVGSPDGQWLASAATKQWSGPGNAYVATSVYLKGKDSSQPPIEVLGFSNDSAYPAGATSITMEWVTPKHLDVTYGSHATLDFQALKCAGIDISVRDTSAGAVSLLR